MEINYTYKPETGPNAGRCKTRKMTAEEWDKYGQPTGIKRKSTTASVQFMKRQGKPTRERISKELLIEECRELGTDRATCEKIAEKYGYHKYYSVEVRIKKLGIKEVLERMRGNDKVQGKI